MTRGQAFGLHVELQRAAAHTDPDYDEIRALCAAPPTMQTRGREPICREASALFSALFAMAFAVLSFATLLDRDLMVAAICAVFAALMVVATAHEWARR